METNRTFVISSQKDRKNVAREIKSRSESQSFIYDDIQKAQAVLYFRSSASRKDTGCRQDLQFAEEHGLPIETVELGGPLEKVFGALLLLGIIAALAYFLVFQLVPNLIGMESPQAVAALAEKNFKAKIEYDYSSDYPIGYVFRQEQSGKRMPFLPVSITVSLGESASLIAVPEIVGLELADAVKMLRDAGFEKCRVTVGKAPAAETGVVSAQIVPAGCEVSSKNIFGIYVSSGDEALTSELNGKTFTLPTGDGDSVEMDLQKGTTRIIEAYVPKSYENAVYIYGTADEYYDSSAVVYDRPVIIEGDKNAVLQFWQETVFNDDVLIRTGNDAVFVIFGGPCVFNGKVYFENNIMQATEDTVLPTVMTDIQDVPIEVLHGSANLFMLNIDVPIVFNGREYAYDDALEHKDISNIIRIAEQHLSYSAEAPNMHIVTQRCRNGEVLIEHNSSHLDMF